MTEPVNISIATRYLEQQSQVEQKRFVFSYTITIQNDSPEAFQLISRHWVITDAEDQVQEVQGLGVIGKQPHIEPGETFTYSSGTILATQTGMMEGSYQMRAANGQTFNAPIPAFALVPPSLLH